MKKGFLFTLFILSVLAGAAQKYGHINFGNLVASMPETKKADEDLKVFRDGLVKDGEVKLKAFEEKYAQAVKDVQEGKLSPLQQQQRQQELEKEQQELQVLEQDILQKVEAKRQELLKPIIDRATKSIEDVAKENGYLLIFDSSVFNAVLFLQPEDDILALAKKKLGLEEGK